MKILVAGDWHSELHEEALAGAFESLGHEVLRFPWYRYFMPSSQLPILHDLDLLLRKAQNKYLLGPLIVKINNDLIEMACSGKPDILFIYRGTHILPETLRTIKKLLTSVVTIGYNNDDPFSPLYRHYNKYLWRHFLNSVPEYDLVLAYRPHNVEDFRQAGARRADLLQSWYIPERNHPVMLSQQEQDQYGCDVVFVGHYEDDGRLGFLEEVVKQGWNLKLYGPGYDWDPIIRKSPHLSNQIPVRLVWGEEYNKTLAGSKIALCFLSKLNRDTYTRRCFEIPATCSLMLSEYTDDLARLFKEGEEADYFRSLDEFVLKIRRYLGDEELRCRVALAGRQSVVNHGHDVISRARQVVAWAEEISGNSCATRI